MNQREISAGAFMVLLAMPSTVHIAENDAGETYRMGRDEENDIDFLLIEADGLYYIMAH